MINYSPTLDTQTKRLHIAICEYDPPFRDGRVNRIRYLSEYAATQNYEVTIYSFGPSSRTISTPFANIVQIKYPGLNLVKQEPHHSRNIKSKVIALLKILTRNIFPDRYIFGIHHLSKEIAKQSSPEDVLIISAPQFSALLILLFKVKARISIIDFRDLWSDNPIFTSRLTRPLARLLEKIAIQNCTFITTTTEAASIQMTPHKKRVLTVYNGVPNEDLELVSSIRSKNIAKTSNPPLLRYFGTLGNRRDCKELLKACVKARINFELYGNIDDTHKNIAPNSYCGFLAKGDMYEKSITCDWLLIVILEDEHAEYAIPGKLYESILTGTPILIYSPNNALALTYLQSKNYPHYHINTKTNTTITELLVHLEKLPSICFSTNTPPLPPIREMEYQKIFDEIEATNPE